MLKQQRVRDPLHGLIEFDQKSDLENALWRVVQTAPFQRLRRIKQLGVSELVYPGATHSRLMHSIGVFHTARRLMKVIEKQVPLFEQARARQALAAALVHDLGHGPFSHTFEGLGERLGLKMANHEAVSDELIRDSEVADVLRELGSGFPDDVADMITGMTPRTIYSAVVSSQFDADRLDYVRRDRLITGSGHGHIDFEWLVENLDVDVLPEGTEQAPVSGTESFVLGRKALFAAEAFVLGLFQLYPAIYYHKTTRGVEKLWTELLERVITLVVDGSIGRVGLPATHPLVRFAKHPDRIESALALDDTVAWGALALFMDAKDEGVAHLARRLRGRKLYKSIDIGARLAHQRGDASAASEEAKAVCGHIQDELVAWSQEQKDNVPRILVDAPVRSPYTLLGETKGPLNQIYIRTEGGRLVDLAERSQVVAQLQTYSAHRAYHAAGDVEAMRHIDRVIDAGVHQW